MQNNSIWNPIVKFISVMAILLSIVAATAACTTFFGWTEKRFGVTALAIVFAAGLTVFSIIELIFILFLKNEAEQVLNYKFKLLVSILIKELFYSIFNFIRKIV